MKHLKEENLGRCPCTWEGCPRKGVCRECLRYHLERNEVPACFFSKGEERSYDRSIKNFIKDWKKRQ